MKKLVAYFSASGVTAGKAAQLAKAVGADLYEIAPAAKYTSADLDWQNKNSRSTLEMNDGASRPQLAQKGA
jgi:flavodoxin